MPDFAHAVYFRGLGASSIPLFQTCASWASSTPAAAATATTAPGEASTRSTMSSQTMEVEFLVKGGLWLEWQEKHREYRGVNV